MTSDVELEEFRQLESEIARLLSCDPTAAVETSIVEDGYAVFDASEGELIGTLHEKCAAIVVASKEQHGLDAGYLTRLAAEPPLHPCARRRMLATTSNPNKSVAVLASGTATDPGEDGLPSRQSAAVFVST